MNDERIVEVMVDALDYLDQDDAELEARSLLAALRDAGFDVYRPDDAVPVYRTSVIAGTYAVTLEMAEADGLVVPVGGDS